MELKAAFYWVFIPAKYRNKESKDNKGCHGGRAM
jgi:hypothetical protein